MRILVIEDEPKSAAFLGRGLAEAGFQVSVSADGEEGLAKARRREHDVIVLDVGLPGRDGWSVIGELQRDGVPTPVLFLTARDAIGDRVRGLELGAEDYLVKPFAFSELLARIRTILRRGQPRLAETLRIADLTIEFAPQRVMRAGRKLVLTATEFSLLAFLVRHQGEQLSRRLLAAQVWDLHFESATNVVDVGIRRLRAKVDDPFPRKLIHTVRGIGYVCAECS
jgi:two-component system copper resistance phosphate regulon response regulator CusR